MNELLTNLLKLQALEFKEINETDPEAKIAELKALIPQPILVHYDRLAARGKKGVAVIRNQVCTGCHMRLPIGTINTLMQHQDIQLCDTCGRYLYLPTEPAIPAAAAEAKPTAKAQPKAPGKARKRK